MTNLSFINGVIYRLKRRYGQSIEFVRFLGFTVDTATGRQTVSRDSWTLNRAVVLPKQLERSFAYDLSFIAANKNFTYGAFYDKGTREILIDKHDIRANFIPVINDYLIWNQGHYSIVELQDYEGSNALYVKAQMLEGNLEDNIRRKSVTGTLSLGQDATSEVQ